MTFQKALTVVYSDAGTNNERAVDEAIKTIKYFEENVLELEDYETDQLYKVLGKITKLEELRMKSTQEQVQVDYQERYLEADNRVSGLEINKQQLHHLLIHVEEQLEEVEGRYQMVKKATKRPHTSDYIDSGLAELRSLIEIAQEHNHKFMEKK